MTFFNPRPGLPASMPIVGGHRPSRPQHTHIPEFKLEHLQPPAQRELKLGPNCGESCMALPAARGHTHPSPNCNNSDGTHAERVDGASLALPS